MSSKHPKRNESSLIPFDEFIRDARNQSLPLSYAKICKHLLEKYNLKVTRGTVFNYVKVRSKERFYYKMLPLPVPRSFPPPTVPETELEAIRRAQWEEKRRVDQSRAENEAKLKSLEVSEKKTFTFDASKPIELKRPQP